MIIEALLLTDLAVTISDMGKSTTAIKFKEVLKVLPYMLGWIAVCAVVTIAVMP